MKKILLLFGFILLSYNNYSYGVQRTWSSSSSTNMNLGANYDGSGDILATDTLVFTGTSIINATATANIRCASIRLDTAYHGLWSIGGFDLTTDYDQKFYGYITTTTVTINGNDSILNDGKIYFDSTIKTLTISGAKRWYFGGNDTVTFNRKAAVFMYGQHITIAANKKLIISSPNTNLLGPDLKGDSTPLVLGAGAIYRAQMSTTLENTQTGFGPFSLGVGAYIDATLAVNCDFKITTNTSGVKQIIPKVKLSDSMHQVSFQNPVAIDTMIMTDSILAKNMQIVCNAANANLVFKTMGYPIILSAAQGYLYMGCSSAGNETNKISFSTSTVHVREITDTGSWNSAGLTVNWDTANVRWSTNLAYSANHLMVPGRSKFLCDSTENSSVKTRNFPFWDLTINKSSHTARWKIYDSLKANDSINILGGVDSLLTVNCAYLHVGGTDTVYFAKRLVCSTAVFDAGSKPVFQSGSDTIFCLKNNGVVNNSGQTLPPIKYPPTISYATKISATYKSAITAQNATIGGGGADSVKAIDALPAGLSCTKTGANMGQITGTPTVVVSKAGYRIRAYGYDSADTWDTITVNDIVPIVASANPSHGRAILPGNDTLRGSWLAYIDTVWYGTTPSTKFVTKTDTMAIVMIPSHAAGTVSIIINNTAGRDTLINGFTYEKMARPRWVDPNIGKDSLYLLSDFTGGSSEWANGVDTTISGRHCIVGTSVNNATTYLNKTTSINLKKYSGMIIEYQTDTTTLDTVSGYLKFFIYNDAGYTNGFSFYQTQTRYPGGYRINGKTIVHIPWSSATIVNSGNRDSNFVKFRVRFASKSGKTTKVVLWNWWFYKTPLTKGNVILTFDDNCKGQLKYALPFLRDSMGWKATLFPVSSYSLPPSDTNAYFDTSGLRSLYSAKWNVCNHTYRHTSLNVGRDTIVSAIDSGATFITSKNLGNCQRVLAYPMGNFSDTCLSVISTKIDFARSTNHLPSIVEAAPFTNPYILKTSLYSTTADLPTMRSDILCADTSLHNLIVTFHDVDTGSSKYGAPICPPDSFYRFCRYLKSFVDTGHINVIPLCDERGNGGYLKYAPDSMLSKISDTSTATSYTVTDSISPINDTSRIYLYDSSGGTWTQRDSTSLIVGGSRFTLTRSGLPGNTRFYYRIKAKTITGYWDSAFATDSVSTAISSTIRPRSLGNRFDFDFGIR